MEKNIRKNDNINKEVQKNVFLKKRLSALIDCSLLHSL